MHLTFPLTNAHRCNSSSSSNSPRFRCTFIFECSLLSVEDRKSDRNQLVSLSTNQAPPPTNRPTALGGIHWTRTDSISIIKAQRKVTSKTKYECSWCPTLSRPQDSSLGVQCATCPALTKLQRICIDSKHSCIWQSQKEHLNISAGSLSDFHFWKDVFADF